MTLDAVVLIETALISLSELSDGVALRDIGVEVSMIDKKIIYMNQVVKNFFFE